jgi:prephenate dehydrogenase
VLSAKNVRIIGSGLIGTSIALALKPVVNSIQMLDNDPGEQDLANSLIGGNSFLTSTGTLLQPDLVIIATPQREIFDLLLAEYTQNPESMFMDIGGIKSELIDKVEELPDLARRFCSSHPMAGREFSGSISAQADLFQGRAWVVIPNRFTTDEITSTVTEIVAALGATAYFLNSSDHDRAIAEISHLPQIISSVLGATLSEVSDKALEISGTGLRDVSRLASSSGQLWADLLINNRNQLLPIVEIYREKLDEIYEAINRQDDIKIKELFSEAARNRARIPGKHGAKVRDYTYLPVVIEDRPGQLAALFQECAQADVNVEDLAIEHSPGQQSGLITLALSSQDAETLKVHLVKRGWNAHIPRK